MFKKIIKYLSIKRYRYFSEIAYNWAQYWSRNYICIDALLIVSIVLTVMLSLCLPTLLIYQPLTIGFILYLNNNENL